MNRGPSAEVIGPGPGSSTGRRGPVPRAGPTAAPSPIPGRRPCRPRRAERDLAPFEALERRAEQDSTEASGPASGSRTGVPVAELRPGAVEQPGRLDRGQLDEAEDDLGRDRHAGLVVVPGPDRQPEPPGQLGAAPLAEQLVAEVAEPLGDAALDLHEIRCVLPSRHRGPSLVRGRRVRREPPHPRGGVIASPDRRLFIAESAASQRAILSAISRADGRVNIR